MENYVDSGSTRIFQSPIFQKRGIIGLKTLTIYENTASVVTAKNELWISRSMPNIININLDIKFYSRSNILQSKCHTNSEPQSRVVIFENSGH